jgi:dCMP deaminase
MNIVVSTGFNGASRNMPHCQHDGSETHCEDAVHAEVNAVAAAAWTGAQTRWTTCYSTLMPCKGCAGVLVNAGVAQVVFRDLYRNTSGVELLAGAGVVVKWQQMNGVIMNWS